MHKGLLETLGRRQREVDAIGDESMDAMSIPSLSKDEEEAMLNAVFDRVDRDASQGSKFFRTFHVVCLQAKRGSQRFSQRVWIGGLVAAAAVIAICIGLGRRGVSVDEHRFLPSYSALALDGGIAEYRALERPQTSTLTLSADDRIDWRFAPLSSVRGGVEVAILAKKAGEKPQLVALPGIEVSTTGSVRIIARLSSFLELKPGNWTLTMYFSRPGRLPQNIDQAQANGPWQKLDLRVEVVAP